MFLKFNIILYLVQRTKIILIYGRFSLGASNKSKMSTYFLNRSIKLMIISHTIKFVSREWRINVKNTCFEERSNRGHQMCFGVLSIMPCATAVNDFGCPVYDLWCLMFDQMFDHVDTNFFRVLTF